MFHLKVSLLSFVLMVLNFATTGIAFANSGSGDLMTNSSIKLFEDNTNLLFYIERSINDDKVIYELNVDEKGVLNEENPIKVYWIKRNNDSTTYTAPLTYIQANFSYGIEAKCINESENIFKVNFAGYDDKSFFIKPSKQDGKYHAYMDLPNSGKQLKSVFINIVGGTFWFPKITHAKLTYMAEESRNYFAEIIKR